MIILKKAASATTAIEENGGTVIVADNAEIEATSTETGIGKSLSDLGYTVTTCGAGEKATLVAGASVNAKYGKAYFEGGSGTEANPWLIATAEQMQNITKFFSESHCYKVNDGVSTIDCANWNSVFLSGSFDGNGVVFTNLDDCLFQVILTNSESVSCIVENFTVDSTAKVINTKASTAIIREVDSPATLKNITFHGYVEGASMHTEGFLAYTNNNYQGYKACDSLYIIDCLSDVTLVGKAADNCCLSGFIGFPMGGTKVYINNSSYEGSMYVSDAKNGNGAYVKSGALYSAQMGDSNFYIYNNSEYVQVAASGNTIYNSGKTYHFASIAPTVNSNNNGYEFEVYSGDLGTAKYATVMIEVRGQNASGTGYPFAVKTYNIDLTGKSGTVDMGFDGVISHIYLNENANGGSITETTFDKTTGTLCVYNPEYVIGYSLPKINVTQYDENGKVLSWGCLEPSVTGNKVVDVYINGTNSTANRPSVFPYPVTGHDYTWEVDGATSLSDVHVYLDTAKTNEIATSNIVVSGNKITVKAAALTGNIYIYYTANN